MRRLTAGVALALLAARSLVAFEPGAALSRDHSIYVHHAQATAGGAVLYRDVHEAKTPLSVLAGAGVVHGADLFGIEPVLAQRVAWPLFALLPWMLLAVWACARARSLALVALPLAALLSWNVVWTFPALGVAPKVLLFASSAAMLLAIEARAWLLCGVLAALGFLDWQIGALLLPAAAAAAWTSRESADAFARIGGGFALVLVATTAWFALSNAATDLWRVAVLDLASGEVRNVAVASFSQAVGNLFAVARQADPGPVAVLAVAHLGAVAVCAWIGVRRRDPVASYACVYGGGMAAVALIEMDGPGDLYAFVTAGVLALFVAAARTRLVLRGSLGRDRAGVLLVTGVAAIGLGWAFAHREASRAREPFGIAEQREVARRLFAIAAPDRVASAGFPELHALVRAELPGPFAYLNTNAWRSLRRDAETWQATAKRLLAPAAIDAMLIARSHSWDGDFRFAQLAAERPPAFVVRTLSQGPLCYELLVKKDAPLATQLGDTAPCPP